MLTISLDRLTDLLEKAADVEIPEAEDDADAELGVEELGEVLADDPAYDVLVTAVEALAPQETEEVLALALLARNAASLDEWQAMVERARAVEEDEASEEIVRVLLLTDEIETALAQLGYLAGDESDAEEEEEEEEEEEGAEEQEEAEDEEEEESGEIQRERSR
jgi:exosome complex component RRP41